MPAVLTAGPGETIGKDAAFEIAAELAFHIGRHALPAPVILPCEREVGLQVLLDDLEKGGLLGTAAAIASRATSRGFDGHLGIRMAESSMAVFICSLGMILPTASRCRSATR
jgi:hypothetical protein